MIVIILFLFRVQFHELIMSVIIFVMFRVQFHELIMSVIILVLFRVQFHELIMIVIILVLFLEFSFMSYDVDERKVILFFWQLFYFSFAHNLSELFLR